MAVPTVQSKGWILALFIRDDNERFLLGSGAYEFKDEQQHFAANNYSNDVIEVQGNDGAFLAGQVRRASVQSFDGYIGDVTVSKSDIEGYRREFFKFFQKNHFYTVVYVMCDGSAIQRRRGYIVDAPEVKEIWQKFPEYHVALNFEDVNYYTYAENDQGQELFSNYATVGTATADVGGLVWDASSGAGTITQRGTYIQINNTIGGETIENLKIFGDVYQIGTGSVDVRVPIDVVEGSQVITISGGGGQETEVVLNLGSIKLAKVDNAQDYIYRSGEKWYMHKETGLKTVVIPEGSFVQSVALDNPVPDSKVISEHGGTLVGSRVYYIEEGSYGLLSNTTETIVYQLENPIDVEISDQSLITELDNLITTNCYDNATIFDVSGDLPAQLEVTVPAMVNVGVVWDNLGAVWEEGGGTPIVTVVNDSITNVAPIITITGPAENPEFGNLTTNQTFYYNGNVTATQTLVINVARKTALLNGVSVIKNISGSWPSLAPGINRLSYTTDNSTAPAAVIEWQEVVG